MTRALAIDGELHPSIAMHDNPTGVTPLDVAPEPRSLAFLFEGCPYGESLWHWLEWDANVPDGTELSFEAQGSDSREPTDGDWRFVARSPTDASPVHLVGFDASAAYFHVRVTFTPRNGAPEDRVSPELLRLGAMYECRSLPD
jgi:hypothetical protein